MNSNNNAQYKNLQNIFTNLYKTRKHFIIQTPEYPKGHYEQQSSGTTPTTSSAAAAAASSSSSKSSASLSVANQKIPKRICGDWSSKLKLLRYTSSSSFVGLHFVSDYSHHFGGYKAKAFMENSEYLNISHVSQHTHILTLTCPTQNKVNPVKDSHLCLDTKKKEFIFCIHQLNL